MEGAFAALKAEVRRLAVSGTMGSARGAMFEQMHPEQKKQDLEEMASSVQVLHEQMSSLREQVHCQSVRAEETSTKQTDMVISIMELGRGIQDITQTVVA